MARQSDKIGTPGLAAQAFERLQQQIVDGLREPGSRLVIDQIADELGTSPIPIREALARLREKHLVDHDPNKGYRVASRLSAEDLRQLFEARCFLETAVMDSVVANADAGLVARLDAINARISECEPGKTFADFRKVLELNDEFHACLVAAAGNRFVRDAHASLNYGARVSRELFGLGVPDLDEIVSEHAVIVRSVEQRDVDAARAATAAHITDGFARFSEKLSGAI